MILGLSALAVTQPLLDLFGNNPEFFVAGNYSTSQIVLFALAIAVVPPALGIGVTALATAINRRLGQVVFVAVIGVLATAFGLALLRTLGVDQVLVVTVLALLIGAGIVVLIVRTKGVRLLVSYLAVANVFFLVTFLFFSPSSELVAGATSIDVGDVAAPAAPRASRDDLPAIDNSVGSYGAADEPDDDLVRQVRDAYRRHLDTDQAGVRQFAGSRRRRPQPARKAGILREEIAAISGDPALHVVHMALPHRPGTDPCWGRRHDPFVLRARRRCGRPPRRPRLPNATPA